VAQTPSRAAHLRAPPVIGSPANHFAKLIAQVKAEAADRGHAAEVFERSKGVAFKPPMNCGTCGREIHDGTHSEASDGRWAFTPKQPTEWGCRYRPSIITLNLSLPSGYTPSASVPVIGQPARRHALLPRSSIFFRAASRGLGARPDHVTQRVEECLATNPRVDF